MPFQQLLRRLSGWLTFTEVEGERMRDNSMRAVWCLALSMLAYVGTVGAVATETTWRALLLWPISGLTAIAGLVGLIRHHARPEILATCATIAIQLELIVGASFLGGAQSVVLLGLLVVIVGSPYLLNATASYALLSVTFGSVAILYAADWPAVVAAPAFPVAMLTVMTALAGYAVTQMRTEINQRLAASLDPLTSVLNRSSLPTRLTELAEQARVAERPLSVVAIDIDHFKSINDRCGHGVGDIVLREVAYRIRKNVRAFEPVYRLGGEEFLVLLPDLDMIAAHRVAERLRAAIATQPIEGLSVTASFGVSSVVDHEPHTQVVERADAELYRAKQLGRNRTCSAVEAVVTDPPGDVVEHSMTL